MNQEKIRNFAIISHVDHGKSTLADRFLELTGTINPRKMRERFLDKLPMERERGVTIKLQAIRMEWQGHILNLIDTPGHTDFSYEVSRALAACEGALLLVDASQGIQAQTLSHAYRAIEHGLVLIPVVNKMDLRNAQIEQTKQEFVETLRFKEEEVLYSSGKTGEGIKALLDAIIRRIPLPSGNKDKPLKALVFDSFYSSHQGVVSYIRVVEGKIKRNEKIKFMSSNVSGKPLDIGVIREEFSPAEKLEAGEVGYMATGFKEVSKCPVGDTITTFLAPAQEALPGYKKLKPMVYASLFPVDSDDYQEFREALERLALNDASLEYTPESSRALGFGFRVGFLGTFHAEIIKERLEWEFGQEVILTSPSVKYKIKMKNGEEVFINSVADFPDPSKTSSIFEPWMKVSLLSPEKYISSLTKLIQSHRGILLEVESLKTRVRLHCELSLPEIIVKFHDNLKSVSSGYASFDYEFLEYREADIVKLAILVNKEIVEPLSFLVIRNKAERIGREVVQTLKGILPRKQFAFPIQVAIGGKIIARETVPAYRKDVTAKLYGGDRTRKDKLLEKQRKGKKRMRLFGEVEIPKEAFFEILKG